MSTKSPGSENEFAKSAGEMSIPNQMDNKDYGKKTKAVARKVSIRAQGDGHKFYGARTIMTKETPQTFTEFLLNERTNDLTLLPDSVVGELRKLITQGAKDIAQNWSNALELVHTAYHNANVRRPAPDQKGAWKQYEDLISFAVKQLTTTRGIDGKWRMSKVMYTEAVREPSGNIGSRRFFVEVPGAASVEADAKTMDDVIEQLSNKMRRHGAKIRVEHRTKEGAVLSVWKNNVKREEIIIKEVS